MPSTDLSQYLAADTFDALKPYQQAYPIGEGGLSIQEAAEWAMMKLCDYIDRRGNEHLLAHQYYCASIAKPHAPETYRELYRLWMAQ